VDKKVEGIEMDLALFPLEFRRARLLRKGTSRIQRHLSVGLDRLQTEPVELDFIGPFAAALVLNNVACRKSRRLWLELCFA
jgi:hypothetical protein